MSRRKWVSAVSKGDQKVTPLTDEEKSKLADEYIVILLGGFNNFGDKIYNYLKLPLKKVEQLVAAVHSGGRFDVREFGEVLAAGVGNPPPDLKEEMETTYRMISFPKAED